MDAFKARVRQAESEFFVAPQLSASDMALARAAGFRTVINNRPDFEGGPEQPTSDQLRAAAELEGLAYHHLPVAPSGHADGDARRMTELVQQSPRPVLAFCRSGSRSELRARVRHRRHQGPRPWPARIRGQLDDNERLMAELGIQGTPGILFLDDAGLIQRRAGMPPAADLPNVLGAR